jgi:1-acyl-sn-glycerol-3-phosphate acyltransferase
MATLPELHSKWYVRLGLPVARVFFRVLLFFLGPLIVRGSRNVPRTGPLLIFANHLSYIDAVVAQLACPRPIYFLAKADMFEIKGVGRIMRMAKAIPIEPMTPDRDALDKAIALLRAGYAVCVFPEGGTNHTGKLAPLKPGLALIVKMALPAVIGLGLRDTNRMLPDGEYVLRPAFRRVLALWGKPKSFARDASRAEIMAWTEAELHRLANC